MGVTRRSHGTAARRAAYASAAHHAYASTLCKLHYETWRLLSTKLNKTEKSTWKALAAAADHPSVHVDSAGNPGERSGDIDTGYVVVGRLPLFKARGIHGYKLLAYI